jgi:nucleoside-diphosphate-sugar epimerase
MTPSGAPTQRPLVLVTGAGGVMGERLVRELRERGYRIRGLVLPGDPARARLEALGVEVVEGDVSRASSLDGIATGVDTVFHLAAIILSPDLSVFPRVNRDGTAHVVAAARDARVSHFIYVSSASVTYPKRTPYAQSKLEAEQIVSRERAFAWTIVRPTLVYDARGGQEFVLFREYLERFPWVPFIGDGRARKRPVWTDDLVSGLVALVENPLSHGKTYNLSGGESISIRDLAELILRHRGQRRRFIHVPVPVCRAIAAVAGVVQRRPLLTASTIAGIIHDADLDPEEATRDLGYRPLGVRAGFQHCFPLPASEAPAMDHGVSFARFNRQRNDA